MRWEMRARGLVLVDMCEEQGATGEKTIILTMMGYQTSDGLLQDDALRFLWWLADRSANKETAALSGPGSFVRPRCPSLPSSRVRTAGMRLIPLVAATATSDDRAQA